MANIYKQAQGSKHFNRNVELSKGAALVHDGAYVSESASIVLTANATCIDQNIYIAGRRMKVVGISEVHTTAGTDAGTVSLTLKKCTGTTAPASGTALHSTVINLKGTAQTVQSPALTDVESTLTLEPGDRLGLDFTGTITTLAGVCVTVDLIPA